MYPLLPDDPPLSYVDYRNGVREILNFQNEGGLAKAYQVRQFIKIVEKYNLQED